VQTFKSKVDIWLGLALVLSISLCLAITVGIALKMDIAGLLIALLVTLLGIALPLWILLATKYYVDGEKLKIKSGPFSWVIPINEITEVKETRNPLSSPALSLDRLQITYQCGKLLMVSPKNKQAFLVAINQKI